MWQQYRSGGQLWAQAWDTGVEPIEPIYEDLSSPDLKFKWCCLDESTTLPGGKIVKFSEYSKKIPLSGKVLCVFCNDIIN